MSRRNPAIVHRETSTPPEKEKALDAAAFVCRVIAGEILPTDEIMLPVLAALKVIFAYNGITARA